MKAYKGFDKNLQCRGYQYEVGKEYTTDAAALCKEGFHACENPLDVLDYYSLLDDDAKAQRFAEVDLDATSETEGSDSKRCGTKIKINAELDIKGFIKAAVDFIMESTKAKKGKKTSGEEHRSKLAASGDGSQLAASGDGSQLAASGDGSKLAASGDGSKLAASGYGSQLAASGDGSVVMNAGVEGSAKAAKGCWITLSEWVVEEGKYVPAHVVTKKVDGKRIKADTWYCLEGGKFQEVKE